MTKIIGRLKDVGLAKEAVRGGGAAPTFWVPKSEITFEDKSLHAEDPQSYGSIAGDGNQPVVARQWAEGQISMDMMEKNFGLLLLNLLGSVSTSGPSDSAYTHTFTLQNDSQHDSLAISVNEEGIGDLMYRLAMIESLRIVLTPEDVVKLTVNFMAKKSVGSSHTVSYSSEFKFAGRDLRFKLASLTSGLSAASEIPLRRLEIEFQKNLRTQHYLGSVEPSDFPNQAFRISGAIELDYEDRTYRDLDLNGSFRAVRIYLVNDRESITGGTTNPEFRLDLSRVHFNQWEQVIPNDEIAHQTFNFMALHDITNGNMINSCVLINGQSSY